MSFAVERTRKILKEARSARWGETVVVGGAGGAGGAMRKLRRAQERAARKVTKDGYKAME